MLGFYLPLWWSMFIFILIWPPSWNKSISTSAYSADWIGIVWPNRRGAANNFVLLVLHQYIGAANQLALIYWRCKHLKNPRNFLSCKMSVCLRLLVLPAQVAPIYWCYEYCSTCIGATMFIVPIYWCYNVCSTNILVLLVLAAPISAHTELFTTW